MTDSKKKKSSVKIPLKVRIMKSSTFVKNTLIYIMVLLCFGANLNGQCSFDCVDTINVSVSNLCTATITPDMLLQGYDPMANEYFQGSVV